MGPKESRVEKFWNLIGQKGEKKKKKLLRGLLAKHKMMAWLQKKPSALHQDHRKGVLMASHKSLRMSLPWYAQRPRIHACSRNFSEKNCCNFHSCVSKCTLCQFHFVPVSYLAIMQDLCAIVLRWLSLRKKFLGGQDQKKKKNACYRTIICEGRAQWFNVLWNSRLKVKSPERQSEQYWSILSLGKLATSACTPGQPPWNYEPWGRTLQSTGD